MNFEETQKALAADPLFGDIAARVNKRLEAPAYVDLAYNKYLSEMSKMQAQADVDLIKGQTPMPPPVVFSREEFEKNGEHRRWMPLIEQKNRGTVDQVATSVGRSIVKANLSRQFAKNEIRGVDNTDISSRLDKLDALNDLDPVDGNLAQDVLSGGAGIATTALNVALKDAAPMAVAGGAAAAVAGQLGPQVATPEEVVTIPVAARAGFTLGNTYGWYLQGFADIRRAQQQQGNDSTGAKAVAYGVALPYALVEHLQLGKLLPKGLKGKVAQDLAMVATDSMKKVAVNAAKTYGKTMSYEVGTEVVQEGMSIFAEDAAAYLNGKGYPISKEELAQRGQRLYETAKAATKGFALLPVVGIGLDAHAEYQASKAAKSPEKFEGNTAQDIKLEGEGAVLQKVYMKGFAARLTSIRNNADNMLVGAGKKKQQQQVMKDELNQVVSHYQNIEQDIQANPELLKELGEINSLIPDYKQAVEEFIKKPSKEGFKSIKLVGDKIAELGINYRERIDQMQAQKEGVDLADRPAKQNVLTALADASSAEFAQMWNAMSPEERTSVEAEVAKSSAIRPIIDKVEEDKGPISQDDIDQAMSAFLQPASAKEAAPLLLSQKAVETLRSRVEVAKNLGVTKTTVQPSSPSEADVERIYNAQQSEAELVATKLPTPAQMVEIKESIKETPITPEQEKAVTKRVISRFPAKIKDQASLETVGKLIAKDLGLPEGLNFQYVKASELPADAVEIMSTYGVDNKAANYMKTIKRQGGIGGFTNGQRVMIIVGDKISEEAYGGKGAEGLKAGKIAPSQGNIKRVIVHELGHIMQPAKVNKLGHRMPHHKDFANWVNQSVEKLFGHREIPGTVSPKINFLALPTGQNPIANAVATGQQIAPNGQLMNTTMTDESAIGELRTMLGDYTRSRMSRSKKVKALHKKQAEVLRHAIEGVTTKGPEKYWKALSTLSDIVADPEFVWKNPISDAAALNLQTQIDNSNLSIFDKLNATQGLQGLIKGEAIPPAQKNLLANLFKLLPKDFPQPGMTLGSWASFIWRMPYRMLAGFDNSMHGRQAWLALPSHPVLWAKTWGQSWGMAFSPAYTESIQKRVYHSPNFDMYRKMGINIQMGIGDWDTQEETVADLRGVLSKAMDYKGNIGDMWRFMLNWATVGFRATDRAAQGITLLRCDLADQFIRNNEGLLDAESDQWAKAGEGINNITGRTGMFKGQSGLNKASYVLSHLMFSLQLNASRLKFVYDGALAIAGEIKGLATKEHDIARRQIASQFLKCVGIAAGSYALLCALYPGNTEPDPEGSDFGKFKIGDTRYDVSAGFGQYIRFFYQMMTGMKKSATGDYHKVGRAKLLADFARSKAAPQVGLIWDTLQGKTVTGDVVDWTSMEGLLANMNKYLVPMIAQDVMDVWDNDPKQLPFSFAWAVNGGGVQSYPLRPGQQVTMKKNDLALGMFGKKWDEVGPIAQKAIRQLNPQLELMEHKVEVEREDYSFVSDQIAEQKQAGKAMMHLLSPQSQQMLLDANCTLGGFSRRIGSSKYYLNDSRFQEYQDATLKMLQPALDKLTTSSEFLAMGEAERYQILEVLINKAKNVARDYVIGKAKAEDLEMVKGRKQ